jgi:anti-sigma-K factor RskA
MRNETLKRGAMEVADRVRDAGGPAEAAEARRIAAESRRTREALAPAGDAPSFEAIWAGVERRIADSLAPAPRAVDIEPWWRRVLAWRPALVLVPAGAAAVVVVLGLLLWSRPQAQSNACFVESYEADEGSVLIDQDPDDPGRPTVIWHLEEG